MNQMKDETLETILSENDLKDPMSDRDWMDDLYQETLVSIEENQLKVKRHRYLPFVEMVVILCLSGSGLITPLWALVMYVPVLLLFGYNSLMHVKFQSRLNEALEWKWKLENDVDPLLDPEENLVYEKEFERRAYWMKNRLSKEFFWLAGLWVILFMCY